MHKTMSHDHMYILHVTISHMISILDSKLGVELIIAGL